jgi:hypothetical protein
VHRDFNILFFPASRGFPISPRNSRRKKEQNTIRQAREKAKKGFVFSARGGNGSLAAMKPRADFPGQPQPAWRKATT